MEPTQQVNTAADIEQRASRVADPALDLKTRYNLACELREMLDTVKDSAVESRVIPHMVPVLLELLRSGEPSFQKDSPEYAFRKVLLEILHRIPPQGGEGVRTQAVPLFSGMLHLMRYDNEENGVTCCKTILDLVRTYRALTEELLNTFMDIFREICRGTPGLVHELLSEESEALDTNVILPSMRSFKVLSEMGIVAVAFLQVNRAMVLPVLQEAMNVNLEFIAVEAPAQKKAREDYEAMGGYWAGMAPTIRNATVYGDFVLAQIKVISFLAYFLRGMNEPFEKETEQMTLTTIRLLQDCPGTAISSRKDLMVVFRHLVTIPARRVLLPHLEKLFDERILLGTSLGSQETIRSNAYGIIADLLHHLRGELSHHLLTRTYTVFLRLLQNPYISNQIHILSAKMIFNAVEVIVTKDTPQNAAKLLTSLLDASLDKLESMTVVYSETVAKIDRAKKGDPEPVDYSFVEKARPIAQAAFAVEKPEELLAEYRLLFRTFLHGFRHVLAGLKKCDAPVPDGTVISRMFEGCVKCMSLFDNEPREAAEIMDWFSAMLCEVNLHVFQEVWTLKMEFMFDIWHKRPALMHIVQTLFGREAVSPTLVAIVLRFLIDRLELLGDYDDAAAVVAIRLYKMVFGAITIFPALNEPILAAHLGKLIMDCFPLAAKASRPMNYFHLLRALFRAIGGGGGRFELLYKEVLPLLPDMLECLNRQLLASEGQTRDLIVELCLTVPLRLTHLLPYLTYLMQPLALALRGGPELVSQGLRTLELCIDNLTPDFLDPTLNTVLRELMEALHSHLKPLPANHHHAHTTIRILGKLGGRNRRLLSKEPSLKYNTYSDPAKLRLSFSGTSGSIELGSMSSLALRTLKAGKTGYAYRTHAFGYLETCASLLLAEGVRGRDREEVFLRCLGGIFDAIHLPEIAEQAENYIRTLSRYVFTSEIRKGLKRDSISRRHPSPVFSCYLEALPLSLARDNPDDAKKSQELVAGVLEDLIALPGRSDMSPQEVVPTLHQIASRFSFLCLDETWQRKTAGCSGIKIMTNIPDEGVRWISDREVDLVRVLMHVLKDMPYEIPKDIDEVNGVLSKVLRVGRAESSPDDPGPLPPRHKLLTLAGIFFAELQVANPIVRKTAQMCIELLSQLSGRSINELLLPNRERGLTSIYTKPLRALPFKIQIGMIEAVRYCLSLDPPLPELNDELLRLLHEALGLADADDTALIGRNNPRQSSIDVVKLRIACIKLLTAAMPLTDFFSKQHHTRQRLTSVYFKSLYSPDHEVKDVAHDGLRMILMHQTRLPKDLLQTGLRPILMNLADPKRLSVAGLEGLARLLELLTNYFKVEIGHKLLDHFRIVADPQMLQASSRLPLSENEGIRKLVRLANIFHLLPSAANIFLESLVNNIVQTESAMHFSSQSPFSEPLAKYLDRYPVEAIDFFMKNLQLPNYVRTLRTILQAKLAPHLFQELISRTPTIVSLCLQSKEQNLILAGLHFCSDFTELSPGWLMERDYVVEALLALWRAECSQNNHNISTQPEMTRRYSIMLSIFTRAMEEAPRIDLLFELVAVFSQDYPLDQIKLSQFLHQHVALNQSLPFRRNVLIRFMTWFPNQSVLWTHKTYALRFIITPLLLSHAAQYGKEGLLDPDIIQWVHSRIWIPMLDDASFVATFGDADDMFKIELLHLTTVLVQRYPDMLMDAKKDIIKCAWHYITSEDSLIRHTADLLAARFFESFDGPQKFILRVWTGLLRPPHAEGRGLIRQSLDILAPVLQRSSPEPGYPQWAKTTRRMLSEDGSQWGWSQIALIYQLMCRQPDLFYPVRALFIPHVVNQLQKLGLMPTSGTESRVLSIDILQVIFDWEQKATSASTDSAPATSVGDAANSIPPWTTPLALRESMVSYLVRLATTVTDAPSRSLVVPRVMSLLRLMVSATGWADVTVKLHFFSRMLFQNDLNTELTLTQALNAARVLQIVSAEKPDSWYTSHSDILTKLVRKGLLTEETPLHECLHPVFDRLMQLYPLPKEDEEQQGDIGEFFTWIHNSIGDSLRNATSLKGTLLMLKSVVQVVPERIQTFSAALMKLLATKAKDHISAALNTTGFEGLVRLLIQILEICQISVAHLGEQRRQLLLSLVVLVEKSKSATLCRWLLDLARDWALHKRDAFPTMKEKATLLQRMVTFEARGERGEPIFQSYLELIYDIYTEPTLRRSDLTSRLEQSFLLGCRVSDTSLRERYLDLLDASVPRGLFSRLTYIFGVQNWEALADYNWVFLALHLLLGSVDTDLSLTPDRKGLLDSAHSASPFPLGKTVSLLRPMQRLFYLDPTKAHDAWISVFPTAWVTLSRREQVDITHHLITLLSKEYLVAQSELRPNIVQTLLAGINACTPAMTLPPHLVKYLAKNFGAWHVSLQILETSLDFVREDEMIVRDTVYDSLVEIYAELSEEDLFYGLWRKRSLYNETNVGIAFEQSGMWEPASAMYEVAQNRARSGHIPFSEPEYCLWEDHWMLAAEKLQQWDTLYELARSENNYELMLESAWRIKDWTENRDTLEEQVNLLPEVATPRRRVFEAFIALLKLPAAVDKNTEFTRILEDAMQLSLRKWVNLPPHLSTAHIPLLQHFQQFVELQEAVQIFGSLSSTTAQNLEKKSADLKMVLQAWRERLPNVCDDINIWSDLVAWRQNVFNAINKAYIPLTTPSAQSASTGTTNTFGYRGFHETAWIINRFAHVARKHELLDVCFTSLNKIYTLPNIEISEAFLKLREQARCHYQKPGDLQAGLEVINNTNLMYFSTPQKAEFYTLKGMFHAKLDRIEEANTAFAQAVQLDMQQSKAWAAWGKFNDRMFKERPNDMSAAANAVSCYLQAAGLYKNHKSRLLLTRVLWLLSVDDSSYTISRAFDTYKGDAAFWYWITLIPQLCLSLSQREVKQARYILLNLAKLFPQALFFHLRTTKEDMAFVKRQAAVVAAQRAAHANQMQRVASSASDTTKQVDSDHIMADATVDASGEGTKTDEGAGTTPGASDPSQAGTQNGSGPGTPQRGDAGAPLPVRQAWEHVDEVGQILKTAFPLLIMSLETIVEQIAQRFKATPEEEIYRLICMLLQDAMQQYCIRTTSPDDDGQLAPQTTSTLVRLSVNLSGTARKDYEEDFITSKPTLWQYIQRLQQWREKYEKYLDSRPRVQSLDLLSHYLTEFQYGKFDDIEIPGQYTEDKDSNQNFVKLSRFGSKFENCRAQGYCFRRFTMHGHDNSETSFAVHLPSGRHCRREERFMQVFRTFNVALSRRKESYKRNLQFHLPASIPCGPNMRLLQNDSSYITLGDIYDYHCEDNDVTREDAIFLVGEKMKSAVRQFKQSTGHPPTKSEQLNLKKALLDEVQGKVVPDDIITRFMIRTMDGPSELWRMRKQFTLQFAALNFMTYVTCLTSRLPSRFHISRNTGQIFMSELLPGYAPQAPVFSSTDSVPFRLTPNIQNFMGEIFIEGTLAASMMAIARCLTEPEFELEQHLCLFARDEVMTWLHTRGKPWTFDISFRGNVAANIDGVVKRAEALACKMEREQATNTNLQNPSPNITPVFQNVTNLISTATNPLLLMRMSELYQPWF